MNASTESNVQEPVELVTVVRATMRIALAITLAYGAYCVFVLVLWSWLAALLALLCAAVGERAVLKIADKQIDAAAQFTADKLTSGYSWLRTRYAAATAKKG